MSNKQYNILYQLATSKNGWYRKGEFEQRFKEYCIALVENHYSLDKALQESFNLSQSEIMEAYKNASR